MTPDNRAPAEAQERQDVERVLSYAEGAGASTIDRNWGESVLRGCALLRDLYARAPQPQGDRAALVGRAKDVLNVLMGYLRAHRWGEERPDYESAERAYWRLQGELSSLSSPAEATERPAQEP